MANQVSVTIGESQWSVVVATTYTELTTGLSGMSELTPGAGMLFDMGSDQNYISVNMSGMLFPLDIIFINSTAGVVGVLRNVQPGDEVYFQAGVALGARLFLEVNAGEAEDVSVGDSVDIQGLTTVPLIQSITAMSIMVPVIAGIGGLVGGAIIGKKAAERREK